MSLGLSGDTAVLAKGETFTAALCPCGVTLKGFPACSSPSCSAFLVRVSPLATKFSHTAFGSGCDLSPCTQAFGACCVPLHSPENQVLQPCGQDTAAGGFLFMSDTSTGVQLKTRVVSFWSKSQGICCSFLENLKQ